MSCLCNGSIEFNYRKPFDILAKPKIRNDGPLVPTNRTEKCRKWLKFDY